MSRAEFDQFANDYERDLARSLSVTGENRYFYAKHRIDWTANCIEDIGLRANRIIDYGCGDGAGTPLLAARFQSDRVMGIDVSAASIAIARQSPGGRNIWFATMEDWVPDGTVDMVFVNGVFHHIVPDERAAILTAIRRALRPGGIFAFWENNPWNPGTRYVMTRCVFDENAITISPREARAMLARTGFRVLRSDFHFYFPRRLAWLRPAERWLLRVPLGGQYHLLCQNPT